MDVQLNTTTTRTTAPTANPAPSMLQVAFANHRQLADAGVFAVNLIGGPGCGKTSLLQLTVARLILNRRIGIIAADPQTRLDADRLAALGDQVLQVDTGMNCLLTADRVRSALRRMNLGVLDLLLIENVSSLIGPTQFELGEDARVAMFSVAAGADKPTKYPDVVRCANVVILNKTDLLALVPFDIDAFRSGVRAINPRARVIEMSTLTGDGSDAWLDWLLAQSERPPRWADVPPLTVPSSAWPMGSA